MSARVDPPAPPASALADLLAPWLPTQRWFAGKGHTLTQVIVTDSVSLPAASSVPVSDADTGPADAIDGVSPPAPSVVHLVVGVQIDGEGWQTYQVPVSIYEPAGPGELGERLLVGRLPDGRVVLDALTDPRAMSALLADTADPAVLDPAETHGHAPALGTAQAPALQVTGRDQDWVRLPPRRLAVEQSNTSFILGDQALVKVFRRLAAGANPDIEVHAALLANPHLGRCLGWVNGGWHDPGTGRWSAGHLAMAQELLSPAVDGWELACARVAAGESFAAEASSLGTATAEVHRDLRRVLPSRRLTPDGTAALVARLSDRLATAAGLVPEVAELAPALQVRIEALAQLSERIEVQRVHGDYHLGQVLLTGGGWKLLDFEGEPGAEIAARTAPDHVLRDVAGMLRSFAYAAAQGGERLPGEQVDVWRGDCERAFLAGYAATRPEDADGAGAQPLLSPGQRTILTAYLVDKAAYEAVYEKRNRPDWLRIPLAALAEIAG